jgi:hypothetical protein
MARLKPQNVTDTQAGTQEFPWQDACKCDDRRPTDLEGPGIFSDMFDFPESLCPEMQHNADRAMGRMAGI